MKKTIQHPGLKSAVKPSDASSQNKANPSGTQKSGGLFAWMALLAGAFFLLFNPTSVHAHASPAGCTGSGLGIFLFTDSPDVHIGDTLNYGITVYNGSGVGPVVCDATSIMAFVTTPDGIVHPITLLRTNLSNGQGDYYPAVVSYVVRAQDVQPDGTVRARATDTGVIHQNDTDSQGGGDQGVNTEVSLPCIQLAVQCTGSVGENGAITFTGTVTNCGNNTLVGVTVTNFVNGGQFPVTFITNLLQGQSATFSGSWIPLNACSPSTATLVAQGVDQFTTHPRTVTSTVNATCSDVLTPGIKVTKTCPVGPVAPGQLLTFSGSVSNTGNVTLTGIVVVNNQPSANTTVFTLASLAPGAITNFTGSYLAPTNCSVTDTLTATATSSCGTPVTNTATATCAITTTPLLQVTVSCPASPPLAGTLLIYSGTVTNTGNITLTNVVVLNNLSGPTPVFTVVTLAPGTGAGFTGSYFAPTNCSATSTTTATGQGTCGGTATNFVTSTCAIITSPALKVTQNCPAGPVAPGGLLIYSGTVTNIGNITLTNIVVLNNLSGSTPVFTTVSLAPGVGTTFTGSYLAPTNCSVTSTSTATGQSVCGVLVTNAVSSTCAITTTPVIIVTQTCPLIPAIPGGLLTFSGSVSNGGNISLTNVVVLNNLSGATPIFTAPILAPGAVASFTGSYLAPTNCSITSTSTATGRSTCGIAVTNTVTSTCQILTTPAISVTQSCPNTAVPPGGILTYSGSVSNAGNVTLTNIIVVSDRPADNTTIFMVASLAPGATTNFTGSYQVPFNCCVVFSTVQASGQGCAGATVTDTATRTCIVLTQPAIVVTKVCTAGLLSPGDLLTYSGTVSNSGNITLINVSVADNQSPGSPPLPGPINLAPGESVSYDGSYIVPPDFCGSDTVTASALDVCTYQPVVNSVITTCPITTSPAIAITKNCPLLPTPRGGLYTYSGSVSNAGNVSLINVYVVDNEPTNNTPVLGPITLAPGVSFQFTNSYVAPVCCCLIIDTLTATGRDRCSGSNVTAAATTVCPLLTVPKLAVVQNCPPSPVPMGSLYMYSGYVTNTGDVVLTNVLVFGPPGTSSRLLGPIQLAPGESEVYSGSYLVPFDTCSVTVTATGQETCGGTTATNTASCPVATITLLTLTQNCPLIPAVPGGLLTYSGSVSNGGNITLANVVVLNNQSGATPVFMTSMLAPGAVANFTGSYLAPAACFSTSISTAIGQSICGVAVTNQANTTCPITTTPQISIRQTCPVSPVIPGGLFTYSGSVSNAGNIAFTNVTVLNNLSGSTPVFITTLLAPGAVTNFTGSFLAPTNCSVTSLSTAIGLSPCSAATNTVSSTCPIITTPLIVITQNCPVSPAIPGGLFTYSGSVSNAGNITFTNVTVRNNLSGSTPVFITTLLAPGAVTNFTGSFLAPTNCSVTSLSTAIGLSACSAATNTVSSTCPITVTPLITITQTCPISPVIPGGLFTYSGSVSNAGNITFTNVTVLNNLSGTTPIFITTLLAPGAVTNFTGSFLAPTNCSVSSLSTAIGLSACSTATNTVSSICPITVTPLITITQTCPIGPVIPGGLFTYSGSVSNAGNITFTNVTVLNNLSGTTPIFITTLLAPGAVTNFTGSFLAPTNCSVTSLSTAIGLSVCSAATNTVSSTCPITVTPLITITQTCPIGPVIPGGLFTYSGSVSNAGNITFTNVTVLNNLSGTTPIFITTLLAPGAVTNFTGSFLAPTNCSVTSLSTAIGLSACSAATNTVSSTCPITVTPLITITQTCPISPVIPGGLFTYSGSVSNAGNITFTNVTVLNNLSGSTPVFITTLLAPGAVTNFTGSYLALTNCSSTSISTVTGGSICGGSVTNLTSSTCAITTAPSIAITETCPPGPVTAGSSVTYTGVVSNNGNVTLTNVLVFSSNPSNNTPVLGPIMLAPGAFAPFSGTYIASSGSNPTTNTTIVTNSVGSVTTNVVSTITTNITTTFSTNIVTPVFGTIDPVTGILTDRFSVPAGLKGLMFADQDENWGPTLFYALRTPAIGSDQFVTISTNGSVIDRFALTSTNYDSLTMAAPNVGYGVINFYYLRHDASSNATFGEIIAQGASTSGDLWAVANTGYTGLAFAAANVGSYGANLFYYVRNNQVGLAIFGTIDPTPGGIETDRYNVGTNFDSLVFVPGTVSTWGTAIFAYLRHTSTNSIIGTIDPVSHLVTDRISLGTNRLSDLTFTATDVGYGANLFYYIRPTQSFVMTNLLTAYSTNTVTTLITNSVSTFVTNSIVTFTPTNTVTTIGMDVCLNRTVVAAANCQGPLALVLILPPAPLITAPAMANGSFSMSFATTGGKSYTLQFKNKLTDPAWTSLQTVTGTGGNMSITNAPPTPPTRFYRIMATP